MSDPALQVQSNPLTVEGFEDVFAEESPLRDSRTVQDQTEESTSAVQDRPLVRPISVDEAAGILGISSNAVCKRLRKGTLVGRKIQGKFKDEWVVEGAGLIDILEVDFGKIEDSPINTEDCPKTVQDQTKDGPSIVPENGASIVRLLDLVERQAAKLEAASGQIGYLQAQLESQTKLIEEKEGEIKLLMDSQKKTSAWTRFWLWFTGQA